MRSEVNDWSVCDVKDHNEYALGQRSDYAWAWDAVDSLCDAIDAFRDPIYAFGDAINTFHNEIHAFHDAIDACYYAIDAFRGGIRWNKNK